MPKLKSRYDKTPPKRHAEQNDFIGEEQRVLQRGFNNSPNRHAGDRVVVACKLPHGLRLRVCRLIKSTEPNGIGQGMREIKIAEVVGEILLHGTAVPFGKIPKFKIVGGYALTENISKELWDLWFHDNQNAPYVKERLVFAMNTTERAADKAEEHEEIKSNLEPLTPPDDESGDTDARLPKPSMRKNVGVLESADRENA